MRKQENQNEPGHGNSLAAWSAVIIGIISSALLTLGWVMQSQALLMVGGFVAVIALAAGPVLAKLGYGVAGKSAKH